MSFIRYRNQSTSANVQALLDLASNPLTSKIRLASGRFHTTPFLTACVTTRVSQFLDPIMVVFDGAFLTAATTGARADEVTSVMDALVNDQRVSILLDPLVDTSALPPEVVIQRFDEVDHTPLTNVARQTLKALLWV